MLVDDCLRVWADVSLVLGTRLASLQSRSAFRPVVLGESLVWCGSHLGSAVVAEWAVTSRGVRRSGPGSSILDKLNKLLLRQLV